MKGSNKQFARYLDNEYNDYYLEAPDDDEEEYDFEETYKNIPNKNAKTNNPAQTQDNNKPKPQEQAKKPVPKKSRQPEFKANFTSEKTPLTNIQMKKFVNLLGQDAKNCFYNLKEIQLPDTQVMDLFKPLYTKFETVPVLFLSVVPNQAVYLWQVNRLCPYQKATNYMVLDSRAMTAETKLHISMLLLAKIGQPQGEEIIDAKFAGQGKLIIKSKIGKGKMVIRLYKVKSFFPIARVNPFKQEVLATDEYSLKLVIDLSNTPINACVMMASLWKRKTTEEITAAKIANYNADNASQDTPVEVETLLDTKTLENVPGNFDFQDSSFSEVFIVNNDLITLVDYHTSTVLSWKDTLISLNWLEIGIIQSAHLISNDSTNFVYLVTTENQVHELDLSQFPSLPITDKSDRVSLNPFYLPGELQKIVQKSSEPYIFTPFYDSAMVFNFSDQKILLSPLGETEGHSMNMEVAQLEKELEKTKTFSWSVVGSRGNNKVLLHLWEHYLNFSYPFYSGSGAKSVELPFQETDKVKVWQILGVNGRVFLCGRFHNRSETTILEVRYDAFSDPYEDCPVTVSKEEDGKTYESNGERLFCQVIGPGDNIAFIRFDNEPYYNDSLNMMYDVPISLVNPLDGKKSKGNADINQEDDEEKKEEERIEKINKLKSEVKHMKGHGRLEENKDKLKEVRAEIGSKIKDIKKFDEEFKKQQNENNHPNNKKKEDAKVVKVPKGVSKESLELYDEIKTEKKKIEKERGKEKTQRKKDRNFKNDM